MTAVTGWLWSCLCFCVITRCLVNGDGSHVSISMASMVGGRATLPCLLPRAGDSAVAGTRHVQWAIAFDTVFERRGGEMWQHEDYEGRLTLPEDRLRTGNCSLTIDDVQVRDAGRYDIYTVTARRGSTNTRSFVQTVELSVQDHADSHLCRLGEDAVLQLYTPRSAAVLFQPRNASGWSILWMRAKAISPKLEYNSILEVLTMRRMEASDEGAYKILDRQQHTVGTVQLYVDTRPLRVTRVSVATAGASVTNWSAPTHVTLLFLCSQTFQML